MFEDAIAQLDTMGLTYTEGEDGSLTIDIADAGKTDVVNIVAFLNDNGLDYTIDDVSIIVQGDAMPDDLEPDMDMDMEADAGAMAFDELGF